MVHLFLLAMATVKTGTFDMLNIVNRADAITHLCNLYACYRETLAHYSGTFGPIREAWEVKLKRARAQVKTAIFLIRENDYENAWTD